MPRQKKIQPETPPTPKIDVVSDTEKVWSALVNQCLDGNVSAMKLFFEVKESVLQNNSNSNVIKVTIIDD